jgi:hypothetical protein
MTPLTVLERAGHPQQGLMALLVLAMIAAVVVLVLKLSGGRRLAGGSAFLSGLRLGGPVIGGLGAAFSLFNMALGYANQPVAPPPTILAPGFAEALLQIVLGFLAGAVAVFAHWAVESRIDRQVLGG